MSSGVLDQLANQHIITGYVTVVAGVYTLSTSNDDTLDVTDAAGNPTLTFAAFNAAPTCVVIPTKVTHSALVTHTIMIESTSTTTVELRHHSITDGGAATDVASADQTDGDGFYFIIVGQRDR